MEVMWSRQEGEKYNLLRSRHKTGIMPLLPILSGRAKSQGQILEVGKGLHISMQGHIAKGQAMGQGHWQ